jgi:hypothetical protein
MHVALVYPEEANVVKPRPGTGCVSHCCDVICKPLPSASGLSLTHQCCYASRSQGVFPFPTGGEGRDGGGSSSQAALSELTPPRQEPRI